MVPKLVFIHITSYLSYPKYERRILFMRYGYRNFGFNRRGFGFGVPFLLGAATAPYFYRPYYQPYPYPYPSYPYPYY